MAKYRTVHSDFGDFCRDRHIDAQTSASARLAPTLLLTNESGVNGDIPEHLGPADWAKVVFDIDHGRVVPVALDQRIHARLTLPGSGRRNIKAPQFDGIRSNVFQNVLGWRRCSAHLSAIHIVPCNFWRKHWLYEQSE